MEKLLPFVICVLLLAYLSDYNTKGQLKRDTGYKDRFFFFIILLSFFYFVGLRIAYNDTSTYISGYNHTSDSIRDILSINYLLIGQYPGFEAVNIIMRSIGFTQYSFILAYSVFYLSVFLWFMRKYSKSMLFAVFLFIAIGQLGFALAAIKQCTAVAFCLIATDAFLNKKKVKYVLFIIIAALFHPYALLYFVLPFLGFTPWSKKTYLFLTVFLVSGIALQGLLIGGIFDVATMIGGKYSTNEFSGEGLSVFRVLIAWVPLVLSIFVRKEIGELNNTKVNLFINLMMINAGITFIGLFGTANYFIRLAYYFEIFQVISLPFILSLFDDKSRRVLTIFAIIGYSLYFVYSNAIAANFDSVYARIKLSTLFKK